jgi:hypothetical protein
MNVADYKPGCRWPANWPTPQTDPDLFTDDQLRAEIRHLAGIDKRHGAHHLRAMARLALTRELAQRSAAKQRDNQKGIK